MRSSKKLPRTFWIISAAALVWNTAGVAAYLMEVTMSDAAMVALPEAQQALYAARPDWVAIAFAISVFTGLGGSIALLLRNAVATSIFLVSLVAIIAQMFYVLVISDLIELTGTSSAIMPSLIILIAGALLWFSANARNKDWIG